MLMYRKLGLKPVIVEPSEIPDYIAEMIYKEVAAERVDKQVRGGRRK